MNNQKSDSNSNEQRNHRSSNRNSTNRGRRRNKRKSSSGGHSNQYQSKAHGQEHNSRSSQGNTQKSTKKSTRKASRRNRNNSRNNNRNNIKRKGPKLSPEAKVLNSYWTHLLKFLQQKLKYFRLVGSDKETQKRKAKQSYYQSLEDFRYWEEALEEDQKKFLAQRNFSDQSDDYFSKTNNVTHDTQSINWEGPFEEQHLKPSQKDHAFSNDTQETIGTMEDYHQLKGSTSVLEPDRSDKLLKK